MNLALLPKIPKVFPQIFPRSDDQRQQEFERAMLRFEAEIGGKLFGSVPKGHHRRFFCLDEHTWIWHEEWTEKGQTKVITTRYDVRPDSVIKTQDGQPSRRLSLEEAQNLYRAVQLYQQRVDAEYQRLLQTS